jgi:hypothetical protein
MEGCIDVVADQRDGAGSPPTVALLQLQFAQHRSANRRGWFTIV